MANIIDGNTLFYLRGDSYSDFSSNNISVTNNGTSIDDSGYVCGKSISFSNNCIRFDKENLIPDTDNFTIEFWINFQTIYNGAGDVFRLNASADNASRYCAVGISNMSGILSWHVTLAGATSWLDLGNIGNPSLNTWIHVAVVREGAYIKCYYNGTYKASSTVDSFELHRGSVNVFGLDTLTTYNTFKMEGLLITKGAKYTANFTPSKEPYTSITISELSYTDEALNLLVTKSTNEEIHKIEVLVNGVVIKTYNSQTLNFGDTVSIEDYLIYGKNAIEVKAYYLNDDYFVSKSLSVEKSIEKLTNDATFKDIMDHTNKTKSNISNMNNLLTGILTTKGISTGDDPKMFHLIKLVGQMSNVNSSEITGYLNQISELTSQNDSLISQLSNKDLEIENNKLALVNALSSKGVDCSIDEAYSSLVSKISSFADLRTYLYEDGVDSAGFDSAFNNGHNTHTLTKYSTYIQSNGPTTNSWVALSTNATVAIKNKKYLCIEYQIVTKSTLALNNSLEVYNTKITSWTVLDSTTKLVMVSFDVDSSMEIGTYTVKGDVSALNGTYSLCLRTSWGGTRITKIWLE